MATTRNKTPRPKSTAGPLLEKLFVGSQLVRVYDQPPGEPARASAFNPHSNGRASPVLRSDGKSDAAMYAAIASFECAIAEFCYHVVFKKYDPGSTVSEKLFENTHVATLTVKKELLLVSARSAAKTKIIRPGFESQRAHQYADTQADAQLLYDRFPKAAGIAWPSARGLGFSIVLYKTRVPKRAALSINASPQRLSDSPDLRDYVRALLGHHGIRLAPLPTRLK